MFDFESGHPVYMDLSKAFDRVNHRLLLYKLDDFGLSDGLILLIESYLQERVQFVNVDASDRNLSLKLPGFLRVLSLDPCFLIYLSMI
jgi:hypothetical protein